MGQEIEQDVFQDSDYQTFQTRLLQQLNTLRQLLTDPNFGTGEQTIGAEIELSIADAQLNPSLISQEVLNAAQNSNLQHELNQYNLEYNLSPVSMTGHPFSTIRKQIDNAIDSLDQQCILFNSCVVPIGILPTLQEQHIQDGVMTDVKRYHALANSIRNLRKGQIRVDIHGHESLQIDRGAITLEGANTSFQLQLKVPPQDFADVYNAVQIATPLAVAVGANSPILLNKILWEETRIALFKQSIDCRRDELHTKWRQPHRVSFGYGWLRRSALECFAESVALFPPLLPVCKPENYKSNPKDGPDLFELKLHQGVVWHWNRAVYDPIEGGHLRIEMRSLPSGPTTLDMVANAAFLIGLTYTIKKNIDQFLVSYPFMFAEYNFYRAAKHGLEAQLVWPLQQTDYSQSRSIIEILNYYIPQITDTLVSLGVDEHEASQLMNVIQNRIDSKQNGACWQRQMVKSLEPKEGRAQAIKVMLEKYIQNAKNGQPIHEWSLQ